MAHVRRSPGGRPGYQARYTDPRGRGRTKTFARKYDAERFLERVGGAKQAGDYVDPAGGRELFDDQFERWWSTTVGLRWTTRARDRSYADSHVLPTFGPMRLAAIDHDTVQAWVAGMVDAGYAPSTVHKAHQLLAKVLDSAVKSSRLGRNVTDQTDLPTIERREQRFLTPAEVGRLADSIDPRYRALVLVGAYGGLRPGEMYALRRSRVDLLAGTVEVAETLTEVSGHLQFGPPKTRAGRRVVPLPQTVVRALEGHVAPMSADELVFTAPLGGPIRRGQFRKRKWLAAVDSADVAPLRIHDLRHTAVALWIAAGASPSEIARRAGHTSVSVVLDRYGHLLPTSEDHVTDRLDLLARRATEEATVIELEAHRPA